MIEKVIDELLQKQNQVRCKQVSIRTFIAIKLSSELQRVVLQRQNQLMQEINGVKWVEAENLHLTLKFLGDTDENAVKRVWTALNDGVEGISPFSLVAEGIGGFPNSNRARVLWLGVGGNLNELNRVYDGIETALVNLGWPREKARFHPHITLGRVRNGALPVDLRPWVEGQEFKRMGSWLVKGVSFMQSELTRRGPIYTTLAEILLRPN
ncbi:MAG: RNA 2',3'-cyclic phosphodiesterase [Firmicutes bacterium]|nr:RNA 2',3'-cyclic phosphodiesterase [Bacillota bacterium]